MIGFLAEKSAKNERIKDFGLGYKFKLKDLSKYSQRLRYSDINWILN